MPCETSYSGRSEFGIYNECRNQNHISRERAKQLAQLRMSTHSTATLCCFNQKLTNTNKLRTCLFCETIRPESKRCFLWGFPAEKLDLGRKTFFFPGQVRFSHRSHFSLGKTKGSLVDVGRRVHNKICLSFLFWFSIGKKLVPIPKPFLTRKWCLFCSNQPFPYWKKLGFHSKSNFFPSRQCVCYWDSNMASINTVQLYCAICWVIASLYSQAITRISFESTAS